LLKITNKKNGKQQETSIDYSKEAFAKEKFWKATEHMA
jgi:hypothetical protein